MDKKKGYILYFDILGYRNILQHNSEEENNRIANIISSFSDFYSKSNVALGFGYDFDEKKLLVRSFSDNFLFVYELDAVAEAPLMNKRCSVIFSNVSKSFMVASMTWRVKVRLVRHGRRMSIKILCRIVKDHGTKGRQRGNIAVMMPRVLRVSEAILYSRIIISSRPHLQK